MSSALVWSTHASISVSCFFFTDPATTEIYTLSLHDALPISSLNLTGQTVVAFNMTLKETILDSLMEPDFAFLLLIIGALALRRSEEHTSELQSRPHLVCRLLLEKKKIN